MVTAGFTGFDRCVHRENGAFLQVHSASTFHHAQHSETQLTCPPRELCPNGAAEYLFIAGILLLVLNLLGIMAQCAQKMAEKVRVAWWGVLVFLARGLLSSPW